MIPAQGEIWWAEAEDKRRPVLVVTRSEAVPVLTWIIVAPVTRTAPDIPTEVPVGRELPVASAASFNTLQPIRRAFLTQRAGALAHPWAEICRALSAHADC